MKTIVNERTMDFFDFISEGFKIFFTRVGDFSLLALGLIIPTSLLLVITANGFTSQNTKTNVIKIILLCLILALEVVVGLIASMSSKLIVESIVKNKPISLAKAINLALSKWGRAFVTQLFTSLIILGLTLLLFIPGVIYSIYYLFMLDAVALRDKDGREALKYSKTLIEGQWWRIFWISMGIGIIFSIFNGLITFLLSKVSANPYFAIVPNAITLYIASIFGVVSTVLFLNIDFVYHRRLAKRKEIAIARNAKKAPTIEEYLKDKQKTKTSTVKRSTVKKVARKVEKTKPVAKRNTRKKE
ncbi:MAG: hypothetical protein HZB50_19020 [Chloroflexi bacterium]|nr:hypothetical protein [Chloroflexota bacterium]